MMCSACAERDASFGRDVRFARDVCLRQVKRNTSHHCEHSEQHHDAVRHRITCAAGANFIFPQSRPFLFGSPLFDFSGQPSRATGGSAAGRTETERSDSEMEFCYIRGSVGTFQRCVPLMRNEMLFVNIIY